jgi:hypothetical protein
VAAMCALFLLRINANTSRVISGTPSPRNVRVRALRRRLVPAAGVRVRALIGSAVRAASGTSAFERSASSVRAAASVESGSAAAVGKCATLRRRVAISAAASVTVGVRAASAIVMAEVARAPASAQKQVAAVCAAEWPRSFIDRQAVMMLHAGGADLRASVKLAVVAGAHLRVQCLPSCGMSAEAAFQPIGGVQSEGGAEQITT